MILGFRLSKPQGVVLAKSHTQKASKLQSYTNSHRSWNGQQKRKQDVHGANEPEGPERPTKRHRTPITDSHTSQNGHRKRKRDVQGTQETKAHKQPVVRDRTPVRVGPMAASSPRPVKRRLLDEEQRNHFGEMGAVPCWLAPKLIGWDGPGPLWLDERSPSLPSIEDIQGSLELDCDGHCNGRLNSSGRMPVRIGPMAAPPPQPVKQRLLDKEQRNRFRGMGAVPCWLAPKLIGWDGPGPLRLDERSPSLPNIEDIQGSLELDCDGHCNGRLNSSGQRGQPYACPVNSMASMPEGHPRSRGRGWKPLLLIDR